MIQNLVSPNADAGEKFNKLLKKGDNGEIYGVKPKMIVLASRKSEKKTTVRRSNQ